MPIDANKSFTLKTDWDLNGETYLIPEGVTLKSKGGVFFNGKLVGDNTAIDTRNALFSKVTILGDWVAPVISTALFKDLNYENSLQDVFALAKPNVDNVIEIKEGDYYVRTKSFKSALTVGSNVTLEINGNIRLIPNSYKGSYVLSVYEAKNVVIKGKGCIYGDKHSHKGNEGEWGHGIYVRFSENVIIDGFNVKDCWGDCIYVGSSSKNVTIRKCNLDNGRRQGISVTSADGVTIEDCIITNVSGTNPQAAVDIEPNEGEVVDNVIIRNIHCENCYGGIETWRPEDARIGSVLIERCTVVISQKKWPIAVRHVESARIVNCTVDADERTAIRAANVENLIIENNRVTSSSKEPISVARCKKSEVRANTIQKTK